MDVVPASLCCNCSGRHGDQLLWPVLRGGDSVLAKTGVGEGVDQLTGMCRNAQKNAIRVAGLGHFEEELGLREMYRKN